MNDDDTPVDLTGATVTAQTRSHTHNDDEFVDFTVVVTGAAAGQVTISLTGAQTADLSTGVWDIQMDTAATEPRTLARGNVVVTPDVTRPV